jgi:hypothetical protein
MVRRMAPLVVFLTLVCTGTPVTAQQPGRPAAKLVSLSLDNADIRMALKLLFQTVGRSFSVTSGVSGTVTASLTDVPFERALETILRSNTKPLIYRIEGGIYEISTTEGAETAERRREGSVRPVKIALNYVSARQIVQRLTGPDAVLVPKGIEGLSASTTDNALLAKTGSDDALRELKEVLRLLDVSPRHVQLRVELVVVRTGPGGVKSRNVFDSAGWAGQDRPATIRSSLDMAGKAGRVGLSSGRYNVSVDCRINGDGSVFVSYTGDLKLVWRGGQAASPLNLDRTFSGAVAVASGDTLLISGSTLKADEDAVEALLYLTPRVLRNAGDIRDGQAFVIPDTLQYAAVFDFSAPAELRSLAARAKESFAKALQSTARYEVIPAETIRSAAEKLGLKPPYDAAAQLRIASQVGANQLIAGELTLGRPGNGAARSVWKVRVRDAGSGETVNGMDAPVTNDTVENVVLQAARRIASYRLPESVVLSTASGTVLLDRGSRDGIKPGMTMVALRNDRPVGAMVVTRVSATHSEARLVGAKRGVRPMDVARAAFAPGALVPVGRAVLEVSP